MFPLCLGGFSADTPKTKTKKSTKLQVVSESAIRLLGDPDFTWKGAKLESDSRPLSLEATDGTV